MFIFPGRQHGVPDVTGDSKHYMSRFQKGRQEDVLEPPSWELFGASPVFAQQFRAPQTLFSWNPPGNPGLVFLTSPIMDDLSDTGARAELARAPPGGGWQPG